MVGVKVFTIPKCMSLFKRQKELDQVLDRLESITPNAHQVQPATEPSPGVLVGALLERSITELTGKPMDRDLSESLSKSLRFDSPGWKIDKVGNAVMYVCS